MWLIGIALAKKYIYFSLYISLYFSQWYSESNSTGKENFYDAFKLYWKFKIIIIIFVINLHGF